MNGFFASDDLPVLYCTSSAFSTLMKFEAEHVEEACMERESYGDRTLLFCKSKYILYFTLA